MPPPTAKEERTHSEQVQYLKGIYEVLATPGAGIIVRGSAATYPYETYYRLYFVDTHGQWNSILIGEDQAAGHILAAVTQET